MSRRKGRIIAFQALYSWDVSNSSLEDLLTFSWLQKDSESQQESETKNITESTKDSQNFASLVISGTIRNIDAIDSLIEKHISSSWSKERLNKVTLAILRTSTYEMKFQHDTEPGIIIDEAVNISKDFDTDDSYKFINAVLDKIGKDEAKRA